MDRHLSSKARTGAVIAESRSNREPSIDENIVDLLTQTLDSAWKRLKTTPLAHHEHALDVFRGPATGPYEVAT